MYYFKNQSFLNYKICNFILKILIWPSWHCRFLQWNKQVSLLGKVLLSQAAQKMTNLVIVFDGKTDSPAVGKAISQALSFLLLFKYLRERRGMVVIKSHQVALYSIFYWNSHSLMCIYRMCISVCMSVVVYLCV